MLFTFDSIRLCRWRRVAAVVLLGVLCVQVLPLQSLHHMMSASTAHHDVQDFCPRNPGGPCVCEHHDHDGHSGRRAPAKAPSSGAPAPVFTACGAPVDTPLLLSSSPVKGIFAAVWVLSDRLSAHLWYPTADVLTSQRYAADIFRPPRPHLG